MSRAKPRPKPRGRPPTPPEKKRQPLGAYVDPATIRFLARRFGLIPPANYSEITRATFAILEEDREFQRLVAARLRRVG